MTKSLLPFYLPQQETKEFPKIQILNERLGSGKIWAIPHPLPLENSTNFNNNTNTTTKTTTTNNNNTSTIYNNTSDILNVGDVKMCLKQLWI